jgi:hypothetical protein
MVSIRQILAFADAFKAGNAIAQPQVWHNRALLGTALVALLNAGAAVAKAYDLPVPFGTQEIEAVAQGLSVVWFAVLTIINTVSNRAVGIKK